MLNFIKIKLSRDDFRLHSLVPNGQRFRTIRYLDPKVVGVFEKVAKLPTEVNLGAKGLQRRRSSGHSDDEFLVVVVVE